MVENTQNITEDKQINLQQVNQIVEPSQDRHDKAKNFSLI